MCVSLCLTYLTQCRALEVVRAASRQFLLPGLRVCTTSPRGSSPRLLCARALAAGMRCSSVGCGRFPVRVSVFFAGSQGPQAAVYPRTLFPRP